MALMTISLSPSPLSSIRRHSLVTFNNNNGRITKTRIRASGSSNTFSDGSSFLRRAAQHTVDTYIKSGMVIGLGYGKASSMAIQYLGRQLRTGVLKDIINFAFDDADLIEEGTLIAIIGRRQLKGDESILQEKSILNTAVKLVFMISESQYKGVLKGSIPVLVQPVNWMETAEEIDDMFLGDAEVWRRPSIGYAGPLGGDFPLVTREGHHVLDIIFTSPMPSLAAVAKSLDKVEGVVDHGVVSKFPCTVLIASEIGLSTADNVSTNAAEGFQL